MVGTILVAIYLVFVWFFLGADIAADELKLRAIIVASFSSLIPLIFGWKLLQVPAKAAAEHEEVASTKVQSLETRISELTATKPGLSAIVRQMIYGRDPEDSTWGCFFFLTIKNTGEPTAIANWRYQCSVDGKPKSWVQHAIFGEARLEHSKGGTIVLTQKDSIKEKAMTPIPKGGILSGWCWIHITDIQNEEIERLEMVIMFRDVFGNVYTVAPIEGEITEGLHHYPDGSGGPRIEFD